MVMGTWSYPYNHRFFDTWITTITLKYLIIMAHTYLVDTNTFRNFSEKEAIDVDLGVWNVSLQNEYALTDLLHTKKNNNNIVRTKSANYNDSEIVTFFVISSNKGKIALYY